MIKETEALNYHAAERPGKIEVRPTKSRLSRWEMHLAYLPGSAFACRAILNDPLDAYRYTAKGNLVAVITNGTSVPGLGDIGPVAAKPVQEGISVVFKRLADVDVFDLELNETDPDRFADAVRILEPTFGGVNLKDISGPEGLYIYEQLIQVMNIPVLYENLYSSAVAASACLINALDLAEKRIEDVKVVICGTGSVGIGCARLFLRLGVNPENLLMYDAKGLVHPERNDISAYQRPFARSHSALDLASGMEGADIFLGASGGNIVTQKMVRSMNAYPVVFALSTPEPEISYDAATSCRRDVIVATASVQYPNAISDMLTLPYIFRGALDVRASCITEGMLIAAAKALAELARGDVPEEVEQAYGNERFSFGPEYLIPKPIDPRILVNESAAVARQAIEEGVARLSVEQEDYREKLTIRMGTGREAMRGLVMKARLRSRNCVFTDGANETVLRACSILADEGMANPIVLGSESDVAEVAEGLGLELRAIRVIDPLKSPLLEQYASQYFRMCCRRGIMKEEAKRRLLRHDYFAAMMLHTGECDMFVTGLSTHFAESIGSIVDIIGPAKGINRISSHHLVLLARDRYVLADCAVNIEPTAEDLAEIALLAAKNARALGMEPRVAMLSFSNFGAVDHPFTLKVRKATEILRANEPGLMADGEMQLSIALKSELRDRYFPFSGLRENANVLIFPDLQSGNLALNIIQHMGEAVVVGPMLMGTRLPCHLMQYGARAEEIVNMITVGIVEVVGQPATCNP
ncbi:NADP-dependent malic enzyme [uncultured Desulfobacterium sp.]|uniref:NADP-dependent malic enzyme n=1 Tax=uncultured Desulfobacterium sp. TaxID=201089 RepID=A0A445MVC7_9BACT|nr:NADP-dependent malic enzyme [uncultured Desulfobacterium sp.]